MRGLLVLFLVWQCVCGIAYGVVREETFANLKASNAQRAVIFYRSTDAEARSHLRIFEKVEKKLRRELPSAFSFASCDGSLPVNSGEFQEAGFAEGTWIFTTIPIEGIVQYKGAITVVDLIRHIRSKLLPYSIDDIHTFHSEDELYDTMDNTLQDESLPHFLYFTETWCDMCTRLRPNIAMAARRYASVINVVEVSCSANEDAVAFCARHAIKTHPAFMLMTGEENILFTAEDKTVAEMEKFFDEHLKENNNYIEKKPQGLSAMGKNKKKVKKDVDEEEEQEDEVVEKKKTKKEEEKKTTRSTKKESEKRKKDEEENEEEQPELASAGKFIKPKKATDKHPSSDKPVSESATKPKITIGGEGSRVLQLEREVEDLKRQLQELKTECGKD